MTSHIYVGVDGVGSGSTIGSQSSVIVTVSKTSHSWGYVHGSISLIYPSLIVYSYAHASKSNSNIFVLKLYVGDQSIPSINITGFCIVSDTINSTLTLSPHAATVLFTLADMVHCTGVHTHVQPVSSYISSIVQSSPSSQDHPRSGILPALSVFASHIVVVHAHVHPSASITSSSVSEFSSSHTAHTGFIELPSGQVGVVCTQAVSQSF